MSRRNELLDSLAQVPLFSACSKRDLGIVARHTEVLEVAPGTAVTEEGALGDAFFVVLDGEASVRRRGRVVSRLGTGAWFGELAVLDPGPRNATIVAETTLTVGVIGARVFRAMVRDVPALTEKLLRGMARRLREADLRQLG
ncbi:MAG TPA: cyclic nucleotide-binding domain-containing protein [Candidatus Dormibacteraeota bacterium]|nr:cyclic nucleotide-binding domain-containing protein [Candidatus Dormibacteraeota bacterium]